MIKVVFTHFAPHFEEIMDFLALILFGEKKYPHSPSLTLKFTTNANEIPYLPEGVNFSECLFFGIAEKLKGSLIAAGVPEDQIIDEHTGAERSADSSFRILLHRLGLENDKKLVAWADALGYKDSGQGGDNFTIYRTLSAIYCHEMERGGCDEGVAWAKELARAAFECDNFFANGKRTIEAGNFFERLVCVWVCYRYGGMGKREALKYFFFPGWQKCPAALLETLKRLGKTEDKTFSEIIRMAENSGQRSLSPLGLPRLLYALYERNGLEAAMFSVFKALDAEKKKQENFFLALEKVKDARKISLGDGQSFALLVYSNNQQINCAARYLFQEKIAVVFQEGNFPKRSVQIFSNGRTGVSLSLLYQEILAEENRREEKLGKTPGQKWHFLKGRSDILLNGSSSYPGVPSTLITSRWFEENISKLVIFPGQGEKAKAA